MIDQHEISSKCLSLIHSLFKLQTKLRRILTLGSTEVKRSRRVQVVVVVVAAAAANPQTSVWNILNECVLLGDPFLRRSCHTPHSDTASPPSVFACVLVDLIDLRRLFDTPDRQTVSHLPKESHNRLIMQRLDGLESEWSLKI